MAQKVNPTGFRLGTAKVWKSFIQIHGTSFNIYRTVLREYFQIQSVLFRLFHKNNFILDSQEMKIGNDIVFLNIYYLNSPSRQKLKKVKFFSNIWLIINQLFKLKVSVRFYLKPELRSTATLVTAYTKYLLEHSTMPMKVLLNICKLLDNNLNSKKISYSKSGIIRMTLKGFKIKLSGRLDGSKSQMAKSIEQSLGTLSLTSLKSYVEYKNEKIYTKSGICGLQIWLFYEFD